MNRVENIDRYLKAYFATEQMRDAHLGEPVAEPFVTISRQAGTGGHELANTMLDVFARQSDRELFSGWQVYDKALCQIVAQDQTYAASFDSLVEEEYRSKTNDFFHQMIRSTVDQKMVMDRVFLVVRTIAGMGKSIIVGRAGSHVTRDMPMGVAVRMVAGEEYRIARTVKERHLPEKDARAAARKRDADRARLLKVHFGADINDPSGYDATFNVGSMTHEEIAEAVAVLVKCRARPGDA